MRNDLLQVLRCPVCGATVVSDGRSVSCLGTRRHNFDFARQGYLYLTTVQKSGGDDQDMVRARTEFLSAGYYKPIAIGVLQELRKVLPAGGILIDAGCGEGYYTNQIAADGYSVLGIDFSKTAIAHGSVQAKMQGLSEHVQYAVAGIHKIPVADSSVDGIISIFAPCAKEEFYRVLRPGGFLILAGAGKDHLMGLKRVLYETPHPNTERADLPDNLMKFSESQIREEIHITDHQHILDLFSMTPYVWRTGARDRDKLNHISSLCTDLSVTVSIYQKEQ